MTRETFQETTDIRDAAEDLARRGCLVFRLTPDTCRPVEPQFWLGATSDPARARAMFTNALGGADNYNVGILTGVDSIVVDVDVKNGKQGLKSLEELKARGLPIETYTQKSKSGGYHLELAVKPGHWYASRIGYLDGIDIKGTHGYVVGAGSTTSTGSYTVERDLPTAPAPDWLVDLVRREPLSERGARTLAARCDLDTPEVEAAVRAWLANAAPGSEAGEHHAKTVYVMQGAMDRGASPEFAIELMCEVWNTRPDVGRDEDALRREMQSVPKRKEPIGCKVPPPIDEVFEIDDQLANAIANLNGSHSYVTSDELVGAALAARAKPLVKGLLDQGTLSVWYGPSNAGKTFVLLDLADRIASGEPWAGMASTPGLVFYVAAEGGHGILKRGAALAIDRKRRGLPFVILRAAVDMAGNPKDVAKLMREIRTAEAQFGMKAALIVLDTLSRSFGGQDENSAAAMGAFVLSIDKLRDATGAHLAIVHHSGKDIAKGARGHSILRAATDTEVELTPGAISVTKQRDLEFSASMTFALRSVDIGRDADGDMVQSAVVDLKTECEEVFDVKLTDKEQLYFQRARALGRLYVAQRRRGDGVEQGAPRRLRRKL